MEADARAERSRGEHASERAGRDGAPAASRPDAPAVSEPLEARLARVSAERDALRVRLAEAEQRIAAMPALLETRAELESVRSSISWRIAAPLRRAGDAAKREIVPRARLAVKRTLLRLAPRLRD